MSPSAAASPGELAALRLPDPPRVFERRAARLAALASGHSAAPFLELLARAARGQQVAARVVALAAGAAAPAAGRPLDRERWRLDASWREGLRVVVAGSRGGDLPAPARDALDRLERADDAELEGLARSTLTGAPPDLAAAPFIGAALQVHFTRLAATLDPSSIPRSRAGCPVCGSPPVASVVLGNERTRYLSCSLCAAQWHLPRVQCASCGGTARISYLAVEGAGAGVEAETCDDCRSYLKQLDLQQVPTAEPVADDAASLVLDLLVGERRYRRAGVNLLAPAGEPRS